MTKPNIFEVRNLSFAYGQGQAHRTIFDQVSFSIRQGESVAILGPSGSGKSTLFYMLGCMLRPDHGEIFFRQQNILALDDLQLSLFRNRNIGFIFQQFHLLQRASVLSNIMLPTRYPIEAEQPASAMATARAKLLAEKVGLTDCLNQAPSQLSGGQQQRVAIARALMNDVDVVLADEPTGNLDSVNARTVLDLLAGLQDEGKTIVVITHDREVAARFPRQLYVRDGKIFEHDGETSLKGAPADSQSPKKAPRPHARPFASLQLMPLALENMLRNRMRSLLTMLGVVIGVAAVVSMLTLGNFTRDRILEGYESLGVNRLVIHGNRNWNLSANQVTAIQFDAFDVQRDVAPLREIFPQIELISPIINSWNSKVTFGGRSYEDGVMVLGVNHEYFPISNTQLREGTFFSPHHIELRSSVCIVGAEIPNQLGATRSLLGEIISVGKDNQASMPCRVIGVMAQQKSAIEWFQPDKQIMLPYTYLQAYSNVWSGRIQSVTLSVESGSDIEQLGNRIKGFFDLKYDGTGNFRVDSNTTLVAQMKRFLNIFALLLAGIAFLALLVGGIGIQNMMLVSITDRLKEIGLRKALGATNRSMRQQILLESLVLCGSAGIIGILVGIAGCAALLYVATQLIPDLQFEVVLDATAISISMGAIVAVGVLSGLAPAIKAERLAVIEALRAE